MLNYIWFGMIIFSVLCAFLTNRTDLLTASIIDSAGEAVELIIGMTGTICLWSGLTNIAQESGLNKIIGTMLSPFLTRLFPTLNKSDKAYQAISANVTANLLGLGNAATPLGISAMQELEKISPTAKYGKADRNMIMLVILNTTSIQLVPTMIISVLSSCGCTNPSGIIPYTWASSLIGLAVGITSVFLLSSHKKIQKHLL